MRHSILIKIQGGLAAMYIAQKVSLSKLDRDASDEARQQERDTFKNYALLVGASMESIIHCREMRLQDWLATTSRLSTPDRLAIAIVPVAMYLQEDIPKLQETLYAIGKYHQLDPENIASLVFLGTVVAYLITEKAPLHQLIPEVLETLSISNDVLSKQLKLIQDYLYPTNGEESMPTNIPELIAKIAQSKQSYLLPVAMATYCFLCTPTSFQVAVQRAAQIPGQPSLTLALTGVLVGTYQGLSCIPTSWYNNGSRGADQLTQLADRLISTWAGAYNPGLGLLDRSNVVASPAMIQGSRI
jgi:ADP-ribosylglycohydrolase